jgi:hypothetical protein
VEVKIIRRRHTRRTSGAGGVVLHVLETNWRGLHHLLLVPAAEEDQMKVLCCIAVGTTIITHILLISIGKAETFALDLPNS